MPKIKLHRTLTTKKLKKKSARTTILVKTGREVVDHVGRAG